MEKLFLFGILICILGVCIYIVVPHVFKLIIRRKSLKRFGTGKDICLSFDDGPDGTSTDQILNILREHNMTAMFFITGENALRHPDCVDRIIKSGNIVGEHGFNHIHPWKTGPIETFRDFMKSRRLFASLEREHRCSIKYYRPPYGKYNIVSLLLYLWYKKEAVFWHIDPKDYSAQNQESIVSFIEERIAPGKVILLHDGRYGENNPADITVQAVSSLFKNSTTSRYTFSIKQYQSDTQKGIYNSAMRKSEKISV